MNLNDNSPFKFELPEDDDTFKLSEPSEFSFDQLQSDELVKLDEDITDLTEPVRFMGCICPKCAEKTEVDLSLMPDSGFVTTCASCNKKMHIIRESCACRAKRKSFEINCASCGKLLDQHAHCHSCGKPFPDYFVTFNPDDARRKARNEFFYNSWAAIKNLNFSFNPAYESSSHDSKADYSPQSRTIISPTATSSLLSRKYAVLAIRLTVALALIVAGAFAYNNYKSGQIYAENYFKALYCIKTGADANIKTCTSLKTDWEAASTTGRSFSPVFSNRDEAKSIKLQGEIDKHMQKISDPPKRFLQANGNITKIHSIYLESEAIVQSKPISLQELNSSVENLNKKMTLASQELKTNLPDSLKKELENVKLKYRGMKDF